MGCRQSDLRYTHLIVFTITATGLSGFKVVRWLAYLTVADCIWLEIACFRPRVAGAANTVCFLPLQNCVILISNLLHLLVTKYNLQSMRVQSNLQ